MQPSNIPRDPLRPRPPRCPVCHFGSFGASAIIWAQLAEAWELTATEREAIDLQQGLYCKRCRCNLRSMTLAHALLSAYDVGGPLYRATLTSTKLRHKRLLEINPAGGLTPFLRQLPRHCLRSYPDLDMQQMDAPNETWDILVHSDTLEHVPDPHAALSESHRVLRPGGKLIFTVPLLPNRPSSRPCHSREPSYHGSPDAPLPEFRVWTEYGADIWTHLMNAGFHEVTFHSLMYPESLAIVATKCPSGAAPPARGFAHLLDRLIWRITARFRRNP